jgi:hypothetical protein
LSRVSAGNRVLTMGIFFSNRSRQFIVTGRLKPATWCRCQGKMSV